jgi:CDP-diacylglycerol--glycerol-3-phosphate 3-phosphatidyltransferase
VAEPRVGERAAERAADAAERARLTFRRLAGLDRSGPPPPETLKGQPLNVWTVPNMIGLVRLALIPVFVALAFHAGGQDTLAAIIFAVIAWSDYFDGIAARLTGQYSRFGTLLDPIVDRLLIVSGAVVCFRYELLPRWALILLAVREAFVFGLARYALRHGADIKVNWLGRAGVWPVFSGLFFAMVGLQTVGAVCLYVGLALVITSAAQYLREGLAFRRERKRQGQPSTRA